MSAQTSYGFSTAKGAAGGIFDLAPYAIDSFINEAANGALDMGCAAVKGTTPAFVAAVDANSTAADFEGIVTNNRTREYDLEGKIALRKNCAVGVMRYGRIWGVVAADANISYGDAVYVDANGHFTADVNGGFAIKGRFLSAVDNGVAVIELFNQAQS